MKAKTLMAIFLGLVLIGGASAQLFADTGNGCGLGYAPRSHMDAEQKHRWTPPLFVRAEIDGDGKVEGRSDSVAMAMHRRCVEERKNK